MEDTLFTRLGGQAAIDAVVARLYEKLQADPLTSPMFRARDLTHMKSQLSSLLAGVTGGPHRYSGPSLREAHAPLVRAGRITAVHFDAVAFHLRAALRELRVPAELTEEVMDIVASTKDEVLGG